MTTPTVYEQGGGGGVVVRGTLAPGSPVSPSAMASPQSSAVHKLGEVLKTIIHRTGAFLSEPEVEAAISVVENFVRAFVPAAALPALATGAERAPVEDTALRVPPNGHLPVPAATAPIDYNKLAAAIVALQRAQSAPEGTQG